MAMSKFRAALLPPYSSFPKPTCGPPCPPLSSFSVLFSSVPFKRKPPPKAPSKPKTPVSSKPRPKPKDLASAAVAILKQRSDSRWTELRSLFQPYGGIAPSQVSKIVVLLCNKPIKALRFFDWATSSQLLTTGRPTLVSYATIAHVLARCHFKARAQRVLRYLLRRFKPDGEPQSDSSKALAILRTLLDTYSICNSAPYVYDLLIRACLECRMVDQAIPMFPVLLSRSKYYPQLCTCNSVIKAVARRRGSQRAYAVYREVFGLDDEKVRAKIGISPDLDTYNELMRGFYEDSAIGKVEELWAEMRTHFTPNGFSYRILLSAYCDAGKMMEAEYLWDEMRRRRIEQDVVTYNNLIGGFCRKGNVVKAEDLFREMTRSGIVADCVTYENLIYGYCKMRQNDSALLHFRDMLREGFIPEASTIDAMIGLLCANKGLSEASEVFRDAMRSPLYIPAPETCKFLIEGFIRERETGEALKVREKMVGRGLYPCSEAYKALIRECTREGNNEVVGMLKKENQQRHNERKKRRVTEPMMYHSLLRETSPRPALLNKAIWSAANSLMKI